MKKSYSLALGWWTAKWFCHIGVIKFIEEKNIKINEVSWTSMWSIIWACYALGMTSLEIKKVAKDINILKLFDFNIWKWLVSWDKIYKFLDELFLEKKIEDTKIPLKIIATDLHSWEKIIFTEWKIADAVRSSISLPLIFSPYKFNNLNLIDWGLKSNLPILELDWKDIIAVSAVRDNWKKIETHTKFLNIKFRKLFFSYNFEVLNKIITISMITNEDMTLEIAKHNWKNVVFLSPNLWEFEYYDFKKVEEIALKGYEEAGRKLYPPT